MTGLELLNNIGIEYIGNVDVLALEEKTLIVLGVARGGTSLVSGCLDSLGIFTGDRSRKPVYEDVHLATAFETKDFKKAKEIIATYNKKDIWAFKRPASIEYIDKLDALCKNPIYLIIFKDIFSISNRNSISMKADLVTGLKKAQRDYEKILTFIDRKNPNAFLLSYEKIMNNKEKLVDTLVNLIGEKNVSSSQKAKALDFIEPNPKEYLNASRITKSIGQINILNNTEVKGWAKYAYSDEPAIAELYINNKFIKAKMADEFRQDILDSKKHSTGYCGFTFELRDFSLAKEDKVLVKLKDDVVFINDLVSINKQISKPTAGWFSKAQLERMAEGKYKEADFLRDIASLLIEKKDLENADKIISKALELRPKGPAIIDLKKQIAEMKDKS